MNQERMGKFIAKLRKERNLTQEELAEKLHVSNKSVSRWETGRNMMDPLLITELTEILGITVNELLSGEKMENEEYQKKAEENLIFLKKQNEEYSKRLLYLECVLGFLSSIMFFVLIFVGSYIEMKSIWRIILIGLGFFLFLFGIANCLKIEQSVGYYECGVCHHKYIPSYYSVLFSMHYNRTRYMRCPKCQKKSWNRKTIKN